MKLKKKEEKYTNYKFKKKSIFSMVNKSYSLHNSPLKSTKNAGSSRANCSLVSVGKNEKQKNRFVTTLETAKKKHYGQYTTYLFCVENFYKLSAGWWIKTSFAKVRIQSPFVRNSLISACNDTVSQQRSCTSYKRFHRYFTTTKFGNTVEQLIFHPFCGNTFCLFIYIIYGNTFGSPEKVNTSETMSIGMNSRCSASRQMRKTTDSMKTTKTEPVDLWRFRLNFHTIFQIISDVLKNENIYRIFVNITILLYSVISYQL